MASQILKFALEADTNNFKKSIAGAGAAVTAAFVAAVKVTAEFEKQLSELRGVSGSTEQQMKLLEKQARDLGKSTAFTATEVAKAQTELARLGFTTKEILYGTGGVLDLAAGLKVELGDAAELAGSTMRSFGIDSKYAKGVVDILSKSTTTSALNFERLRESLKLAGPTAKAAGYSLAETVGMLETLANNSIHGSMAGTGLSKIFVELSKKGLSWNDAMEQINTSTDKLRTATDLFGLRANKAALILAGQGYRSVQDYDDAAGKLRETMEDNLVGDFDKLVSAVTELGIQFGQQSTGSLRNFTQQLTELVGIVSILYDKLTDNDFINGLKALGGLGGGAYQSFKKRIEENNNINVIGKNDTNTTPNPLTTGTGGGGGSGSGSKPLSKSDFGGPGLYMYGWIGDMADQNYEFVPIDTIYDQVDALHELEDAMDALKEAEYIAGTIKADESAFGNAWYDNVIGGAYEDATTDKKNPMLESLKQQMQEAKEEAQILGNEISNVFDTFGNNISNSLNQSGDALGAFLGSLAQFTTRAIGMLIKYAIEKSAVDATTAGTSAVAGATSAAAATGPAFPITLPVMIGAALAAVGAAMTSVGGKSVGRGGGGFGSYSLSNVKPDKVSSSRSGIGSNRLIGELELRGDTMVVGLQLGDQIRNRY